ncbi:MBOAT family protein [Alteromonadaceae bacterium M269]|nr:MBOAT family protein [Alteromonadaceae bacterium M269]
MLFNSYEFLLIFLPLCLATYLLVLKKAGQYASFIHLIIFSIGFYSYWNPIYTLLLASSVIINFYYAKLLNSTQNKALLALGVGINLGALGYYKYFNFIVDNISYITNETYHFDQVFLPLAISFFTFQQIAYLVDSYKGGAIEENFVKYTLFVTFFPQLIAGPIVHHKDMLPQFNANIDVDKVHHNIALGLSIFALGLFKKTILADGVSEYATPIFNAAESGETLDFFSAWGGALAYSFQLYFDFSGYSDMAIGIARMFGIILPLNFYSPYKASNISQFWRRWHMTLSRFLRNYVYIPLGGNRDGNIRKQRNLLITMLLGGLWHGAGWNFVIWGGLHGAYLVIQSYWSELISERIKSQKMYVFFAWLVTMFAVVIAWVFFRAPTLDGALSLLSSMFGQQGVSVPNAIYVRLSFLDTLGISGNGASGAIFVQTWAWIILCLAIAVSMPNTQDIFSRFNASLSNLSFDRTDACWPLLNSVQRFRWRSSKRWAFASALAFSLGILTLFEVSEFLYFQF